VALIIRPLTARISLKLVALSVVRTVVSIVLYEAWTSVPTAAAAVCPCALDGPPRPDTPSRRA